MFECKIGWLINQMFFLGCLANFVQTLKVNGGED